MKRERPTVLRASGPKGGDSKLDKHTLKLLSQVKISAAAVAVGLSAIDFMEGDVVLSANTWLLVAAVLGIFAVYERIEAK